MFTQTFRVADRQTDRLSHEATLHVLFSVYSGNPKRILFFWSPIKVWGDTCIKLLKWRLRDKLDKLKPVLNYKPVENEVTFIEVSEPCSAN